MMSDPVEKENIYKNKCFLCLVRRLRITKNAFADFPENILPFPEHAQMCIPIPGTYYILDTSRQTLSRASRICYSYVVMQSVASEKCKKLDRSRVFLMGVDPYDIGPCKQCLSHQMATMRTLIAGEPLGLCLSSFGAVILGVLHQRNSLGNVWNIQQ